MPALRERGNDILLLFRLFAMQMADKYRLPKVTLTDDAKQLLLHYKWPGNVRQLKNITEQMSVLSEKREINVQDLKHFIPDNPDSTELSTITKPGQHSYESEREILYKILYELRGNIADLRRDLTSMRKQIDEERELRQAGLNSAMIEGATRVPAIMEGSGFRESGSFRNPSPQDADAEEIKAEEPESLNLNDLGRQMLEKALERNGGNRKKAAQELGISDRTLYRRIKQYGLDNKG